MKVRAITNYQDKELKRLVKSSEEFEVTDARAKTLIEAKVAEAVAITTDTPKPTEKPAKKPAKKKTEKKEEA